MKISVKVVLRDLWVGVYISPWQAGEGYTRVQRTYVCLLPCLPIVIERRRVRIPVAGSGLGAMTPELKSFYNARLLQNKEGDAPPLFQQFDPERLMEFRVRKWPEVK